LLDDRRYVGNFLTYHANRGRGPLRARAELRKAGVPGELVEDCLRAFPDWVDHAATARRKKFGAARPTQRADQHRQARFLAYRGFTGPQIRAALGVDTEIDLGWEQI
jgi:regulatory protein